MQRSTMVGSGPHKQESMGSQRQNDFLNLERKRDWEGSVHTTHTSRSHSRVGSYVFQKQHNRAMQLEIDQLKRKLRHARQERTPSNSVVSSEGEEDASYRRRSRTPPITNVDTRAHLAEAWEMTLWAKHWTRFPSCPSRARLKGQYFLGNSINQRSPSTMVEWTLWSMWATSIKEWLYIPIRGLGNDTMSKALNQISKSAFMRKIEGAILPRRFHQPTFTIYNSRTDHVKHVSHFNQRMVIHSKDEALMYKVFSSSLGPVAMRWFDSLRANSIDSFKELTRAFGSCFIT